jgi:hypothetical protein
MINHPYFRQITTGESATRPMKARAGEVRKGPWRKLCRPR